MHAAQQLVDGLERLAVARLVADDRQRAGELLEHGTVVFECGGLCTDDDQQVAFAGAHRASRQRCVDEVDARLAESFDDHVETFGADGGGEDDAGASADAGCDACLPEEQPVELFRRADGDEHAVGFCDCFGCTRGSRDTGAFQQRESFGGDIEPGDRERLGETLGHRQAHRSESDHCNIA